MAVLGLDTVGRVRRSAFRALLESGRIETMVIRVTWLAGKSFFFLGGIYIYIARKIV